MGKRQVLRNHTPVVANITTVFDWEVDLFSVGKSGMTYEFEVKISRQDFLKDKKKRKWEFLTWKRITPNYMSYVCPDGLITEKEIPDFMGLYYFRDGGIIEIKKPTLRHKTAIDIHEVQMKVARMYSQREFLGRTLISHLNKEIRERNEEREKVRKQNQIDLLKYFETKKQQNNHG